MSGRVRTSEPTRVTHAPRDAVSPAGRPWGRRPLWTLADRDPTHLQPPQSSRDTLLQNATLSVQEQHATNVILETVSRSLELLSESVQQLAETQQEFVRDSLQLQRETVQVLRDFTSGALALMHDKLNGRPAL